MTDVTKKDLEDLLGQQTKIILDAVDERFIKMDIHFDERFKKMDMYFDERFKKMDMYFDERFAGLEKRLEAVEKSIQKLTTTLDVFLQRLNDNEQEFTLLKAKVDKIASFIKERFDVEISVQG